MGETILSVRNLHTSFTTDKGDVSAVNGVTFNLEKGKILGIVGESGSGKSVTAYSILQILEKTEVSKKAKSFIKAKILQNSQKNSFALSAENAALSFSRIR